MDKTHDRIPLYDILKSFSAALDLISQEVVGHHKKVAYIAMMLGREIGLADEDNKKLVIAALIHDIGVFYLNQSFEDLTFDIKDNYHAEVGYQLTKNYFPINDVPGIIRYHHQEWRDCKLKNSGVIYLSSILYLADRIATITKNKLDILADVKKITDLISKSAGDRFSSEAVDAFLKIAVREYFWLDTTNPSQLDRKLNDFFANNVDFIDLKKMGNLAEIISHIIDFRSSFTAFHSQGVAVISEHLARELNFSEKDCMLMKIAGYVHDIGKLAVPLKILNKPDKLNDQEWAIMKSHTYYTYKVLSESDELKKIRAWASYHHENLLGTGYPFRLKAENLSQGSRIMTVADIFTAITEDRPYRQGMDKSEALRVLQIGIEKGKLDKEIVNTISSNYNEFNQLRLQTQNSVKNYYDNFKDKINDKITQKSEYFLGYKSMV